ncbi:TPA: hypothetical protein ACF26N_002123, partial [Klebsiella quasipneumoniae subsp. similipneumoniae]
PDRSGTGKSVLVSLCTLNSEGRRARPLPVLSLARFSFPHYTAITHSLTEYKRRPPMLYCEMFIVSHALGNGASSSVIGIVLR